MVIKKAEFTTSLAAADPFMGDGTVEIAIVGKSNVGKSSLINALARNQKLARTSSEPGKTRLINLFRFYTQDERQFTLVDLPGYGFAQRSKGERDRWAQLIGDYFDLDRSFNLVVSLVDIRHDPSKLDHQMIEFLQEGEFPFIVALTKADKLSRNQQAKQTAAIKRQLNVPAKNVIVTSSESGQGIEELREIIEQYCLGEEE